MKDVYLGINELPLNWRLRLGNFFVPFSLDQLTPLPNTQFMERSIPSAGIFSPDREVGIASYHISDDLNKTVSLGMFFDDIPESTKQVVKDNQGMRLISRATWLPYYDEPPMDATSFTPGWGSYIPTTETTAFDFALALEKFARHSD